MATSGLPHEGTDNIILDAYTGLQMLLYTNSGDSLTRATVLADLTEPSALDDIGGDNGYAAITLSGVWSSSNSVISYDHGSPDAVVFTNTGGQGSWDAATGSAITDGTYILHFQDFPNPIIVVKDGSLNIDVSVISS